MIATKTISHYSKYKGCIIEKSGTGFKALKKQYDSYEAAQQGIDTAFSDLAKNFLKSTEANIVDICTNFKKAS
jgi:hypothetical protein